MRSTRLAALSDSVALLGLGALAAESRFGSTAGGSDAPTAARCDRQGRVNADSSDTIQRDGLTFDFDLKEGSVAVSERVPDDLLARLAAWWR